MFIFLLQLRHMLENYAELYMFAVYSALIWALWAIKVLLSRRYQPFTGTFTGTTSVVVPVVDEPLDLFRDVLGRMVDQQPGEIIVVINGAQNEGLARVCEEFAPLVRWVHTPIAGKRNAVKIGTEMSTGEITVLVDSDTVWTEGALAELVRPFEDESIGGVTTRQRILDPRRSWITRWADWLENSRALYAMPAQSVLGQVGCLPGRTIAFRRHILMRVMDKFMTERFMGVFLEVSDDRTLTNLTLRAGYRTVYQHTSLVYTDAPLQVRKLYKQQLRWARGSQYNTLRMLPWMLGHAPVLAVFFIMDIILPFLLAGVIAGWIYRVASGQGYNFYETFLTEYGVHSGVLMIGALMVISSVLSMAIRQIRHLAEKPSDFFRLPVFIIVSTAFLMPIRLIGFFRMGHVSGWGTRSGAYVAAGQDPSDGTAANPGQVLEADHPGELDEDELESARDLFAQLGFSETATSGPQDQPIPRREAIPQGGSGPQDQPGPQRGSPLQHGAQHAAATRTRRVARRRSGTDRRAERTARPRLNPKAAWPYAIGVALLTIQGALIV